MKCAICGTENPASASLCVKCGVALSPVYAGTAASPGAGDGSAGEPRRPAPSTTPGAPSLETSSPSPRPATAGTPASATPESAGSPRRGGLIVALLALLVVLGVAGYYGFRMLVPGESKENLAAVETPKSAPSAPTLSQPSEPMKEMPVSPPQSEAARSGASTQQPAVAGSATEAAKAAPGTAKTTPSEDTAAPERGSPKAQAAKAKADASKAPSTKMRPTQTATKSTSPTLQPSPTRADTKMLAAAGTGTGAALAGDRWQQMTESITHCAREDILTRIVCEQRVRLRFCNGYWGQVPQCPSAQNKEHGQ